MTKKLYIETVGCQMNMLDSEMVVASLRKKGYELTDAVSEADTILFNTCSVREHAEHKTYSALGRLREHKKAHPGKVIGVLGCMAQKDQKLIFEKAPYVDIVVGPGQLQQVPDLIEKVESERGQHTALSLGRKSGSVDQIKRSHETFDPLRDPTMRPTPFQAYLRIQIGCDKFCTYCIVPMTRGPEQGRSPEEIIDMAGALFVDFAEKCLEQENENFSKDSFYYLIRASLPVLVPTNRYFIYTSLPIHPHLTFSYPCEEHLVFHIY